MKKSIIIFFLIFLSHSLFAESVSVIVHKNSPIKSISVSNLKKIFGGKMKNYSGVTVRPIDLPGDSEATQKFSKAIFGKSPKKMKSYWLEQSLQGGAKKPKVKSSPSGVVSYVGGNKSAIGYVPSSSVDGSVRVILIIK